MAAQHNISSVYSSGMAFTTRLNGHHSITTDTEAERDGLDKGPRPKALMLVALTGCTGVDVVSILNKMRVNFTGLAIDVRADLTDEDAAAYHTVHLIYTIKVAAEDQPKVEKAIALSMDKYCGVSAMFKKFAALTREIVYL
jgi:putative redox protein